MHAKFLNSVSIEARRETLGDVGSECHGETRSQVWGILRKEPSLWLMNQRGFHEEGDV